LQEFDWEAAVREIDASCERANNPSSTTINQASSSNFTPPVNILNNSSYSHVQRLGLASNPRSISLLAERIRR
jgi:Fanconi anemia group M protein